VVINEPLAARIPKRLRRHPPFGDRGLWALLHVREGARIAVNTVDPISTLKSCFVLQRSTAHARGPRAMSQAANSNER
jgi:hypothetical protein